MTQHSGQHNIAGLCNGSTADSDSVCEGSNPSPAATEKSETVRFWTSFFLFDPLSDPLTVLQLLSTDGVLHIGFHSICTVLLHLLRNMTVYVQSECRGRVTKIRLHGFHIIAISEAQNCDLLFFYDSIIRRQSKSKQMKSKVARSRISQYFRSKIKIFIMIILTIVQNGSIIVKKRWFGDCHE